MKEFKKCFEVIWANIDMNGHMRHSAYGDFAAQMRVSFFDTLDFDFKKLIQIGIGPILFREETKFFKEIHLGDTIELNIKLLKCRKDASKWTFLHQVFTSNGELSATIEVDGAWLDLQKRKIILPPVEIQKLLEQIPKTDNFTWIPDKSVT